ncbi:hypothetical protein EBZ39_03185 [bacterium]|nr:hypothetical protein [bacterium]
MGNNKTSGVGNTGRSISEVEREYERELTAIEARVMLAKAPLEEAWRQAMDEGYDKIRAGQSAEQNLETAQAINDVLAKIDRERFAARQKLIRKYFGDSAIE